MPGRVNVPEHSGESGQILSLVFPLLLSAVCLLSRQETEIYVMMGVTVLSSYIAVVLEYLVANTCSFKLSHALQSEATNGCITKTDHESQKFCLNE